jgi:hypothetical protein
MVNNLSKNKFTDINEKKWRSNDTKKVLPDFGTKEFIDEFLRQSEFPEDIYE